MDSRAKQRLTGAVILVALFVLLVPELLTGPRNAAGDAPSEEGMRRYTIDLDAPPGTASPVSEPAPAVSLPPVAEHPPRADENTRALPGEAAQPGAGASPPAVTAPMSAPPQTVASAVPPASTAETAAPATKPAAGSKPVPATHPAPATVPARGSFAVQLGSFVSRENAERLVRDMTAKGFNAFLAPTIKSGGRDLYRVRVGPTRDRASAEALAAQLRRIGQQGSIVSIS
jgi:DedD protein